MVIAIRIVYNYCGLFIHLLRTGLFLKKPNLIIANLVFVVLFGV